MKNSAEKRVIKLEKRYLDCPSRINTVPPAFKTFLKNTGIQKNASELTEILFMCEFVESCNLYKRIKRGAFAYIKT